MTYGIDRVVKDMKSETSQRGRKFKALSKIPKIDCDAKFGIEMDRFLAILEEQAEAFIPFIGDILIQLWYSQSLDFRPPTDRLPRVLLLS